MSLSSSFTSELWEIKLTADVEFNRDIVKYTALIKQGIREAVFKKQDKQFEFKPHEHLLQHKRFATWKEYSKYYKVDKLSAIFYEICQNLEIPRPSEYYDKCKYNFETGKEIEHFNNNDHSDEEESDSDDSDLDDVDGVDGEGDVDATGGMGGIGVYNIFNDIYNNSYNLAENRAIRQERGIGVVRDIIFYFCGVPKYDAGIIKYNCLICMDVFNSGEWVYQCNNCKDVIHLKCYQKAKKITNPVRCCICSRAYNEAIHIYTLLCDGVLVCRGENN